MKNILKITVLTLVAALTLCGCGILRTESRSSYNSDEAVESVSQSNASDTAPYEILEEENKVPAEESSESWQQTQTNESLSETQTNNVVTVNGNYVEDAELIYTYNPLFGHYFTAMFLDDGDAVFFMAVFPEELCASGAEYSGNGISANGILFDLMIIGEDYYCEYDNVNNPEVFDNLSVRIDSINLYENAKFSFAGDCTIDGRIARISVSGQSDFKEMESQPEDLNDGGSGYANDGTCLYCGGNGICNLCYGLGYTSWGGYENRIICSSCDGTGYCYYCQGTGIQIYLSRGVKLNP